MARLDVCLQPGGLSLVAQVHGAVGRPKDLEFVFLFLGPTEVVIQRIEVPVPPSADSLDEARVGRRDKVVEGANASAVDSKPLHERTCLPNDLPFSSERQGRLRAYHGREEPRAKPAASRHETTCDRTARWRSSAATAGSGSPKWHLTLQRPKLLAAAFIERPVQASAFTLTDATAIHPTQRGQLDAVLRALVPIVPGLGSTARRYCKAHPWSACHSAVVPAAHEDQHERAAQSKKKQKAHRDRLPSISLRLPSAERFAVQR